jgi:anti-sigma-K factor RskA
MNFEEFEHLARLYVVGALDEDEMDRFVEARREFGEKAEAAITEFRRLNSVFALSLRPHAPKPETKHKLLDKIRESLGFGGDNHNGSLHENHAEQ